MKLSINILLPTLGCLLICNAGGQSKLPPPTNPDPNPNTLDVVNLYAATGWMGDGTNGTKYVQIDETCKVNTRPKRQTCVKITYAIGPMTWAGMYWLNEADNWGDSPGADFSSRSFKKISFWARGERGGEVVEFKAGGVWPKPGGASAPGRPYKDSFQVTKGKVKLEKDWKHYDISVEGQTLSSVIGVFCWVANVASNPSGLTFYLDDIQYE